MDESAGTKDNPIIIAMDIWNIAFYYFYLIFKLKNYIFNVIN